MPDYMIVGDVETTGLPNDKKMEHYIVEVGIILVDLENRQRFKALDTIVREEGFGEQHKNSWVFEHSDLTYEMILNAPSFESVKPQIQFLFDSFPATAFNSEFDFQFLRKAGINIDCEYPCIMKAGTQLFQIYAPWGIKWPSVEEAWFYLFDDRYIEQHRAYNDVEHETSIMFALKDLGYWKPEAVYANT